MGLFLGGEISTHLLEGFFGFRSSRIETWRKEVQPRLQPDSIRSTLSTPKYTAPLVLDDHSICPAFSHTCVSTFIRWIEVTPVVRPVFGW